MLLGRRRCWAVLRAVGLTAIAFYYLLEQCGCTHTIHHPPAQAVVLLGAGSTAWCPIEERYPNFPKLLNEELNILHHFSLPSEPRVVEAETLCDCWVLFQYKPLRVNDQSTLTEMLSYRKIPHPFFLLFKLPSSPADGSCTPLSHWLQSYLWTSFPMRPGENHFIILCPGFPSYKRLIVSNYSPTSLSAFGLINVSYQESLWLCT